jgi:hypothetical protein
VGWGVCVCREGWGCVVLSSGCMKSLQSMQEYLAFVDYFTKVSQGPVDISIEVSHIFSDER